MIIRKFRESDAEKVSALIIHTLQASNSKDYSAETISALEKKMQPSGVLELDALLCCRGKRRHHRLRRDRTLLGQRDGELPVQHLCSA